MADIWAPLIGKKVEAVEISKGRDVIAFRLEGGDIATYFTEGDCCSESWIEHVSGIEELVGGVVTKVEEVDLGCGAGTRQECDKIYCVTMTIADRYRGEFIIEFRNSSNGYYGGSMVRWGDSWSTRSEPRPHTEPLKEDF